jgi:alpha,alpha-trehalose phosphorylase
MGFGGVRIQAGMLSFAPRLPEQITRLAFQMVFRNRCLRVEVTAQEASYHLLSGAPLTVRHYGNDISLPITGAVTRSIPPIQAGPRPAQPPGRAPVARSTS